MQKFRTKTTCQLDTHTQNNGSSGQFSCFGRHFASRLLVRPRHMHISVAMPPDSRCEKKLKSCLKSRVQNYRKWPVKGFWQLIRAVSFVRGRFGVFRTFHFPLLSGIQNVSGDFILQRCHPKCIFLPYLPTLRLRRPEIDFLPGTGTRAK